MAPVPRCDLRLPNHSSTPKTDRTSRTSTTIGKSSETSVESRKGPREEGEYGSVPQPAQSKITRDSAEILERESEFQTSVTRDSAEVLENTDARLSITRDSAEVEEHHVEENVNPFEVLKRCKAEVEQAVAKGQCEQMKCPTLDSIATPGDVCAQFCHDRRESPKSISEADAKSKRKYCPKWGRKSSSSRVICDIKIGDQKVEKKVAVCKGTYKSAEVYTSLWGSGKAINFRKKLEAQMKKKRKLLEKMHHKEFLRRQKMRIKAKQKRRALKVKDQSKIPQGDDNLRINKAYDLRLNYNKQLPLMPITMKHHFDKFKKPPFKRYVTAKLACVKRIDEFEKLRVPSDKKSN